MPLFEVFLCTMFTSHTDLMECVRAVLVCVCVNQQSQKFIEKRIFAYREECLNFVDNVVHFLRDIFYRQDFKMVFFFFGFFFWCFIFGGAKCVFREILIETRIVRHFCVDPLL